MFVLPVRITKPGWVCVFLGLYVPLAALVTLNNFLFIIFSMIVGVVVVSHVLAVRNLHGTSIVRRFPDSIHADTPFSVTYRVSSTSKPWGAAGLELHEDPILSAKPEPVIIPNGPPGGSVEARAHGTLPQRGDVKIGSPTVSSTFPFGLAEYSHRLELEDTVLVFPAIEPVQQEIPEWIAASGNSREKPDPFGSIPYQFRQYVSGDPYKRIDWKKTAASGQLITRVLSEEGSAEVTIALPARPSERAISKAASLMVCLAKAGIPVGLRGPGFHKPPGIGPEFTRELLVILARWENFAGGNGDLDPSAGIVVQLDEKGEYSWT